MTCASTLPYHLRVRAFQLFHHLADQRADRGLLAGAEVVDGLLIFLDDSSEDRIECAVVLHDRETLGGDDGVDVSVHRVRVTSA